MKKIISLVLVLALVFVPVSTFGANQEEVKTDQGSCAPGEIIVEFSEDMNKSEKLEIVEDATGNDVEIIEVDSDMSLVKTEPDVDEGELAEELQDSSDIEYAQPNFYYTVDSTSTSNDPKNGGAWYLDYLDVKEAWDVIDEYRREGVISSDCERVKVATIDSGIYKGHEDLVDISDGGNFDFSNCVTAIAMESSNPDYGSAAVYPHPSITHGMSTSSVIGATSNNGKGMAGVAAGNNNDIVEVMAINVFRNQGGVNTEHKATTLDICAGIDYACDHGADVIMMCLGHSPGSIDGMGNVNNDALLEENVNWATYEKDVVCVASAGNRNNMDTWYPSDFEACVSVINTTRYSDIDSSACRNSSSSYGPRKDISAPGTGIMRAGIGRSSYGTSSGTSSSAPIVASVAALVRYVNPDLSQSEVKDILYTTTTDLYTAGWDRYTGYGNVNAYGAVTKAAGQPDTIKAGTLASPSVYARSAGKSSVKVSWSNVGAGKYLIYRSTSANSGFSRVRTVSGATSWTDTGLKFNNTYYYYVMPKGTSSDGKRMDGAASGVASSKPRCGVPSITVKVKSKTSARVSWTKAANASGYKIYRSTKPNSGFKCIKTITRSGKGYRTIKKLKSKRKYYYKVRAYIKKNGKRYYSEYSAVKSRTQK